MRLVYALSLVLLLCAAPLAFGFGQGGNPTAGNEQIYCLLSSVSWSNAGIQFRADEPFNPRKFVYNVQCPSTAVMSTVIPKTVDPESTSEVRFNGVITNSKATNNAISNSGTVAQSPRTMSDVLKYKLGSNVLEIGVSCNGRGMPTPCYYTYTFFCSCGPDQGGSVIGDPQFTGLRGQSYQVHGVSGEIYNIVSDPKFQLNSRFVFLDHGKCPVMNGKKQKGCWSHPGSYLGEIGIKTQAGDKIRLDSGSADNGFAAVEFNGKPVQIGDSIMLNGDLGFMSYNTTHMVTLKVGSWYFEYENSDMYVNQNVKVSDLNGMRAHGLLGQTWRQKTYNNAIKHIQGEVDDYVIREHDIFGDNFVYNVFN